MTSHPGNLTSSFPFTTSTRITLGDGASMPITHVSHSFFPSNSTPINMSNVLVSRDLVKNLVSVPRLARDNPLTVEFDDLGFFVKDTRTRMVLHRCDIPDDLYPMHSAATTAPPIALSAGVDLCHACLGHPNSTVLRQILKRLSFLI